MKKVFSFLLIALLSVTFKMNVSALDAVCTTSEQVRLRQLVSVTQITYEFVEPTIEGEDGTYNVYISGFSPDFYIDNPEMAIYIEYRNVPIATSYNFVGGVDYKFNFYASEQSPCNGQLIMTKYLNLIPYNVYSKDPLCVGHETYELCKKFTSIGIKSYDDFAQRMKQYIKDLEKNKNEGTPTEKPKPQKTLLEMVEDFFIDYYMFFLISIIVLGTSAIVVIEVKKRRSIL